jgi:transposase-like protein
VVISVCQHESRKKNGRDKNGKQRYLCLTCNATFGDSETKPLGGMRTPIKQAAIALNLLLEGMSIRSVQRITGLKRGTICDLILTVGENCERLLAERVKNLSVKQVQADEIWSFVSCKERTRYSEKYTGDEGNSWTFIAIDRETKLVLAHQIGQRDNATCCKFLNKL